MEDERIVRGKLIVRIFQVSDMENNIMEIKSKGIDPEELLAIGEALIVSAGKIVEKRGDAVHECTCNDCVAARAALKEKNRNNPNIN